MAFQQLINNLDRDLQYAIQVEGKMDLESVLNYSDVKNAIMEKVLDLFDITSFFLNGSIIEVSLYELKILFCFTWKQDTVLVV